MIINQLILLVLIAFLCFPQAFAQNKITGKDYISMDHKLAESNPGPLSSEELLKLQELGHMMEAGKASVIGQNEKFFTWKHLGSATYEYPKEIRNFVIASGIVAFTKCFGNSLGDKVYKASNEDPVCIQNLLDLMTSPLFYGAFYGFMVGSRYATPAALNAFVKLSEYKSINGKKPMSLAKARFWAGQFGMVTGFFLDQTIHKFVENQSLHECVKSQLNYVGTGKEMISHDDMLAQKQKAELKIFNDEKHFCVKAYRELILSRQAQDFFGSSVVGLLAAGYTGGLISQPIITLSKKVSSKIGLAATLQLERQLSHDAAFWAIKYMGGSLIRVGVFAGGVVSMTAFLGMSELIGPTIEKSWKATTATLDFKSEIKDINQALKKLKSGEIYNKAACPETYLAGEVIEGSKSCSRIPSIAELQTFHDFQKSWRNAKILQEFNMAQNNWFTKWNNFHSHFVATKDILKEFSKLREHKTTGKILSFEKDQSLLKTNFDKAIDLIAKETGRNKDELRVRALQLLDDPNQEAQDANEAYLRYILSPQKLLETSMENLNIEKPLYFTYNEAIELRKENSNTSAFKEEFLSVFMNQYWDLSKSQELNDISFRNYAINSIKNEIEKIRQESINKLTKEEKEDFLMSNEFIKKSNAQELSTSRGKRFIKKYNELNKKIEEIEDYNWPLLTVEDAWFNDRIDNSHRSLVAPNEIYSYAKVRNNIVNVDLNNIDEFDLSYALIALKKLANISPMFKEKSKINEILSYFEPQFQYQDILNELMENYSGLVGYRKDDGNLLNSQEQILSQKSREDKIMPDTHLPQAPLPFISFDLFDAVVTSALCNGSDEFIQNNKEGLSLDFKFPLLIENNYKYCENLVSLNAWRNKMQSSIKNSLFLVPLAIDDEKPNELFVVSGLSEVIIHTKNQFEFMNTEAQFNDWWNTEIYKKAEKTVLDMGDSYHSMLNHDFKNHYDSVEADLWLAIEDQQIDANRSDFNHFWLNPLPYIETAWNSALSLTDRKPSEDLEEALAREFGIHLKYLKALLAPEIFKSSNQIMNTSSLFLHKELAIQSYEESIEKLDKSVKNLQEGYIALLRSWKSVNLGQFEADLKNMENQLNLIGSVAFPDSENPISTSKEVLTLDEKNIFDPYVMQKISRYQIKKPEDIKIEQLDWANKKIVAILISQMVEIVQEVRDLRSVLIAENFNFNINENKK
jgi:hypothetical protein